MSVKITYKLSAATAIFLNLNQARIIITHRGQQINTKRNDSMQLLTQFDSCTDDYTEDRLVTKYVVGGGEVLYFLLPKYKLGTR